MNPTSFLCPVKYKKTFAAYAIEIRSSSISKSKGGKKLFQTVVSNTALRSLLIIFLTAKRSNWDNTCLKNKRIAEQWYSSW